MTGPGIRGAHERTGHRGWQPLAGICRLALPSAHPVPTWGGAERERQLQWGQVADHPYGQRDRLHEGPGPGCSPSPVCSWGRGGCWGPRGREHPGAHALLWRRGTLGLEQPQSVNTEPGGPVGGAALEPSCWLPRGSASEVGSCSLRGTPVGLNGQTPEDRRRSGLGPVLSSSPLRLLAPGRLDSAGCPQGQDRDRGWRRQAPPEARRLTWQLWPVSRRRQTGAPSPARPPPPAAVLRDFPAHEEHLQGTGPAPWALSPGSPLGDCPASKTAEEARPGQCAKSQHLRSCARTDRGSGVWGGMAPAGPSRGSGDPEPPPCRWAVGGDAEPDPPGPQWPHALP